MKKISQREARMWKKLAQQLQAEREGQRKSWIQQFPGGTHIGSISGARVALDGRIEAARMLGHPVVVVTDNHGKMDFYAVK